MTKSPYRWAIIRTVFLLLLINFKIAFRTKSSLVASKALVASSKISIIGSSISCTFFNLDNEFSCEKQRTKTMSMLQTYNELIMLIVEYFEFWMRTYFMLPFLLAHLHIKNFDFETNINERSSYCNPLTLTTTKHWSSMLTNDGFKSIRKILDKI